MNRKMRETGNAPKIAWTASTLKSSRASQDQGAHVLSGGSSYRRNPNGKPKGAKDKRTALRALLETHSEALAQKAVELALEGDTRP
ncbi:MAG: hypothetical protein M3436_20840 [Pseudomonadota bacterium]|nr:hypothetical protein [Pseudomonadota bacterium]